MATTDIYNYIKVDDRIITGGQPTEQQIRDAAAEGFRAIVNLATWHPQNSLPDEAGLAQSLGIAYYHIPVQWQNPTPNDFAQFVATMERIGDAKVLIHCAANYRVSAFFALYALKRLGWTEQQADEFMARIWKPGEHPLWDAFIERMKSND